MGRRSLPSQLLPTLYEDARVLAVAKPAGVDVGAVSPPPPDVQPGVVELLSQVRPDGASLLPVNRLSRFESGVLLLAKSSDAAGPLRAAWKAGRVEQEYLAVVLGRAERRISLGTGAAAEPRAGRTKGGKPAPRTKQRPVAVAVEPAARTTVMLVAHGDKRSLVRCQTNAPNTHVLRAQLRAARLRVLGDHVNDPMHHRARVEENFVHLGRVSIALPGSDRPLVIRAEPDPAEPYLQREIDIDRFLRAALVRRIPLVASQDTNCFRLLTGAVEGLRGIVVEKFGPVVFLNIHEESAAEPAQLRRIAGWYRDTLGAKTIYTRSFTKSGTRSDGAALGSRPLAGPVVDDEFVVVENGLRFLIRPESGLSVGLFLDQRDNRRRLRETAAGKDVLNLFAYTCGFSVAAATGGARTTASVDISPKHLDWGRRNFELNGIDTAAPAEGGAGAAHLFFKSDADEYLRRAKRQDREFDVIIIDAPSFAHGRGRAAKAAFSIATDLPKLVAAAVEVLRPGGLMMISTNYRKMSLEAMRRAVRQGASGRGIAGVVPAALPVDFAMDREHAKTVWVQFMK